MTIKAFTEATLFYGTGSECIGMSDRVGTQSGKLVDLIVVVGDPLKDVKVLGDTTNIRLVVKGGSVEVDRGL